MGIRQKLFGLDNQTTQSSKSFEVWQEEDGSIQCYQNDNPLVSGEYNPSTGGMTSFVVSGRSVNVFQNPRTIAFLGDSMTSTSGPVTSSPYVSYQDRGFMVWANALLGNYFEPVAFAGVSGDKTSDMLARLSTDVLAYSPAWVTVLGGYNDIVNDVSASTTISNLKSIYQQIVGTGAKVVALTILPSSTINTTARSEALHQVNQWIRWYSARNPGIVYVDAFSALVDPTTSNSAISGALRVDNIHPSSSGAYKVGAQVYNALKNLIQPISYPVSLSDQISANNIYGNCIVNPVQQGTGGNAQTGVTGQVASNWNALGSANVTSTASKQARTDFPNLTWQQHILSFAATTTFYHYTPNISLPAQTPVGTQVYAEVEVVASSNTLTGSTCGFGVNLICNGGSGVNTSLGLAAQDGVASTGAFLIRTPVISVPTGTTSFTVQVVCSASGGGVTLQIGRAHLRPVYPSALTN